MAIVKPFKGIRPPKELVEKVESRPYDVLDSEEARAEAGDNAQSLYHIIKPEIDFPVGTSEYDPRVYEKAAENFQKFQDNGWLVQDSREHYYIYAQTMQGKTQYGLVVCAHTDDYMKGNIKKHELTRRDKEEDRMKHVRVNNANIEPVFFAYPDNAVLNELIMRYATSLPPSMVSVTSSGLSTTTRICRPSLMSSLRCHHCISLTVTTVQQLQPSWVQRSRSRIPTTRAMRSTTSSWQSASRLHS